MTTVGVARARLRQKLTLSWLLIMVLMGVAVILVLFPIGAIFYGSVWSAAPGEAGALTIQGFREAYSDPEFLPVLWTSLWLAAARTAGAVVFAIFLAWIIARTDTPLRGFLETLLYIKFFMPFLPVLLGWVLLFSPNSGLINVFLMNAFNLQSGPINIYSAGGIIVISILGFSGFLTIFILPAFRAMDATLEESSRMSGASGFGTLFRITIPMMAPALLAVTILAFVRMMESFESELFLGTPAGIWVFTTKIFDYLQGYSPPRYTAGMALAATLLALTFLLVVVQWKLLGRREYTTVTGRGYSARPMALGRWRYVTLAVVLAYFAVGTVLPVSMVVLSSFMKIAGVYKAELYTVANYTYLFGSDRFWSATKNTLLVAGGSATAGMVLYSLLAYVVTRTQFAARKPLDFMAWIPWAVPGLVLSLGFIWVFLLLPIPFVLYGTIWLMMLAFIARGFPIGTRTMATTMVQVGKELEESSRIHGASWLQTFIRIWLPLLRHGFFTGWMFLFVFALRDLTTVVFLYGPGSHVITTLFFGWWREAMYTKASALGLIMALLTFIVVMGIRWLVLRKAVVPTGG